MFIGRENELNTLERLYESDKFEFVVMYGRRRVGKTRLITEFCKNKDSVYFAAEEFSDELNIEKFTSTVMRQLGEKMYSGKFTDWRAAFEYIAEKARDERLILVVDEFPYIAEANRSIMSILQNIIDHLYADTRIFLILCGSHMSFMEERVLGYKSPLFGRRTAQMLIEPLNFFNAMLFFDNYSDEDKILTYSILGGVPQYLLKFDNNSSLKDNILNSLLDSAAYLFDEPTNLLKQELREPALYNSIIESIARGARRLNEISTAVNETTDKTASYLKNLQKLRIVKRTVPVNEKERSKKSLYELNDNLFKFHYGFIEPNMSLIAQHMKEEVYDEIIGNVNKYLGYAFEDICKEWLMEMNGMKKLPFLVKKIGRWWGNNKVEKKQEEIDIVGINDKRMIFCECKYRNEKIGMNVLKDLIRKSALLGAEESRYYIFSKSGFKDELVDYAKDRKDINLISLNQVVNIQEGIL